MDPLAAALIGALGAAVIGLLGAVIGASVQAWNEHRRWLRERRLEAYLTFMVDMQTAQAILMTKPTVRNVLELRRRAEAYNLRSVNAFESVSLLGPKSVNRAGQAWLDALVLLMRNTRGVRHLDQLRLRRWEFLIAAGQVLGSKNVELELPSRRV